ncbi:MAG: DUF2892 domain-containing protein [bacterium]
MKKNIGTKDRVFRLLLGILALIAVFFINNIYMQIVLIALGIFSIYESLVSWCAFYTFIGKNTCPLE